MTNTSGTSLRLEEITSVNLDGALAAKVGPAQEFAVAPAVKSPAEAYRTPVSPGLA